MEVKASNNPFVLLDGMNRKSVEQNRFLENQIPTGSVDMIQLLVDLVSRGFELSQT